MVLQKNLHEGIFVNFMGVNYYPYLGHCTLRVFPITVCKLNIPAQIAYNSNYALGDNNQSRQLSKT